MECEFCNKILSNKNSLIRHQQSTKACLAIQQNIGKDISNKTALTCRGCKKIFARKDWYDNHIKNCKYLYNLREEEHSQQLSNANTELCILRRENEILKNQIQYLQKELRQSQQEYLSNIKDISKEAKTVTNNNIVLNLVQSEFEALTDDVLKESSMDMTWQHLRDGGTAMANLALNTTFKGERRVIVTDIARKRSLFKDADNMVIRDVKMCQLAQRWCAANIKKATLIYDNIDTEIKSNVNTPDEYCERITPYITNLSQMRMAASGNNFDTSFMRKFSNSIIESKHSAGVESISSKILHKDVETQTSTDLLSSMFDDKLQKMYFILTKDYESIDFDNLDDLRVGEAIDDNGCFWPALFIR